MHKFFVIACLAVLLCTSAHAQSTSQIFSRNLTLNDSGGDVFSLQAFLISQGFLTVSNPTGYFGGLTANALAKWQAVEGLPNTGYFGPLSRAIMSGISSSAPTTPVTPPSSTPSPTSSPATYIRNLNVGDSGADVSSLQSFLISQGFLAMPSGVGLGYFGGLTANALAKWQAMEGLPNTGYFGALSRATIANTPQTQPTIANTSPAMPTQPTITPPSTPSLSGGGGGGGGGGDTNPVTAPVNTFVPPAQPAPPLVTSDITSPTAPTGVTATAVSSTQISLAWIASTDNVGVTGYKIFRNGVQAGTSLATSFLNTGLAASTNYSYTVSAYDAAGNGSAPSASVSTTTLNIVSSSPAPTSTPDTIPPNISITSPIASSTVSSTTTVTANATDNVGVIKVEFYLDNTLLATDASLPYTWSWNTIPSANGSHSLSAKAYDAVGNIGISAAVTVTVVNLTADTTAPSVPAGITVTKTTTSTVSLSWAASTDLTIPGQVTSGMAGYKIYLNGTQVGTSTITSFTNTGLAASTTYTYTIAAYDIAGNTSALSTVARATTTAISQTPPPTPATNGFGMSVGEELMGLDSSTLNSYLTTMHSLGITWLRFDMEWDHIQPNTSSTYSWGNVDTFVAAAKAHAMNLLPVLDYTPSWDWSSACAASVGTDRCPPVSTADYAKFVQAAVTRYAPQGISDWEIWNEPNLAGSWEPAADATAYAALLKAAYPVIKAIQPSAVVLTGGLGPAATNGSDIAPIDFLTAIYAQGAKPYFDAVGFHPYSYPAMPSYYATWNAWSQMASTSPSLRSVMIANGDTNKTIWATEYGAPTGGPGNVESSASDTTFAGSPDHVTEAVQAAMLNDAANAFQKFSWAGPLFWYSYKDIGTSNTTVENFFGILRSDGSTKPAFTTLQSLGL